MKIAVAGMGYVGLSLAMLLAQHNEVCALDVVPEKVRLLNQGKAPLPMLKLSASCVSKMKDPVSWISWQHWMNARRTKAPTSP